MIPRKTTNDQVMLRVLNAEPEEIGIAIWSSWPLIQEIAQSMKRESTSNGGSMRTKILIGNEGHNS